MPYRVAMKSAADRDLDRLPLSWQYRLPNRQRSLVNDPRPPMTAKGQWTRNGYRLRVGDYRIVY